MKLHPAVTVHGLDEMLAALRPGRPVTLLSAPGAAGFAGCLWWRALIAQALAAFPAAEALEALDCADAPGQAMAALRVGQKLLVLARDCPAFPAVVAAAAGLGAVVLERRPASLDLAEPGAARRLEAWLRGDDRRLPLG
jgi:hypothetical protein